MKEVDSDDNTANKSSRRVLKLLAHPYKGNNDETKKLFTDFSSLLQAHFASQQQQQQQQSSLPTLLRDYDAIHLAIGPEGGWTDDEVALFLKSGYLGYSLGQRILRTDIAVPILLQQMQELGKLMISFILQFD
jgi:RsmE family RNA methyltransferase